MYGLFTRACAYGILTPDEPFYRFFLFIGFLTFGEEAGRKQVADKPSSKKRQIKKVQSVRQKAEKAGVERKPRRLSAAGSKVATPLKAAARIGKREYHPIKLPNNKVGRFMTKPRKATPSYFRKSWQELRQVVWPTRTETAKLTVAVFMFAIFFSLLISLADYGLDKLFKALILK
jgi:preprotein translocase SecE subunit